MNDPDEMIDRRKANFDSLPPSIERRDQHYLNQARLALWPEVVAALRASDKALIAITDEHAVHCKPFDRIAGLIENDAIIANIKSQAVLAKIDRLEQK